MFDFPKADLDGLCSYLLDHDFSSCIQSNHVNTVWLRIKEAIMTGMNLFVPKVRLRRNQQPKWFTSHIRHRLNCTKTLRKECKLHPTLSKLSKLSSSEANLCSELAYAKSNYETKLIQQFAYTNNSKIYRYISSLLKSSAGPPCVHLDAEAAVSDQKKACLYNRYFHSVFTSSGLTDPVTSITPIQPSISSILITTFDMYTALATLDPTKAMGIDGIGPRVLKFCALLLSQPLYDLFCLSLKHHDLPEEWQCHLVIPIFKSGDKSSVKNYRPISLLCSVSKVLERLVYNKIIGTIRDRLTNCQYGFFEGRSSLHQLIIFINQINNALDNIGQVDALYLDFHKALNSVPHNELLCKLWKIGIVVIFGCDSSVTSLLADNVYTSTAADHLSFLSFLVCHREV